MRRAAAIAIVSLLIWTWVAPGKSRGKAEATPADPSLHPGALAVVNGRPVEVDDYKRFLLHQVGTSLLEDLLERILLEDEARRLAIAIPYRRIEEESAREVRRRTEAAGGDRTVYASWLADRGMTPEEDLERVRQGVLRDLILDECIRLARGPEEGDGAASIGDGERRLYLRGLRERARVEVRKVEPPAPVPPAVAPPEEEIPAGPAPRPARSRARPAGLGPPWRSGA